MPRCRVVAPNTKRITLSEDDYIDVVAELNAGEYSDLLRNMVERKPFSKILAYLTGWSFIGFDGQPIPYSLHLDEDTRRMSLRNLDKATLREMTAAIDKHEVAEEEALEAKKKTKGTLPASDGTSTSADA